MSFPRYPKYKASGVEWLGEVPEGWGVKPLRYICNVRKGKLPGATFPIPTAETDLPYLSMEYLRGELECPEYVSASKNIVCAESGDILLLWDGSNAGEFLRAKQGAVSSTVALIEPKNIAQQFLFFACKSRERELKDQTIGMGIPHVSGDTLKSFAIPAPPLPEQTAIAEFLDRETGKIDGLVAEQRRLMELLKEKRQAVISHAVTKGLNPHAPMKPSGIEWLGDVPEHWNTSRLKYGAARIVDCPHETPTLDDNGDYLTIRTADIADGKIFPDQMRRVDETEYLKRIRREPLLRHDIVYSREGERWGHSALVEENGRFCLGQRMMQFRAAESFDAEFLMWQLNGQSVYRQGDVDTVGATAPHVNVGTIRNYLITEPPAGEQREIASFLKEKIMQFDTLTAEAQRAINLLQERRTALISAAVTGQIDVRPQTFN